MHCISNGFECASGASTHSAKARYLANVPMRIAQPSEVAAAIAFLAGETAAFITGQTLFVDGGASLGGL
jgi:3-oxoacyl-[acyl-carrier protein] reductase